MTAMDIGYAAIVAPLDPRLSDNDLHILDLVARWPYIADLNEVIRAGDITLDALCARTDLAKECVFYSVAVLEGFGYLPNGGIR